jgi:hypothetical protein
MILIALAASAAASVASSPEVAPVCPVNAHIVGVTRKDAPLYDIASNTAVGPIQPAKGGIDPPMVILKCSGRYFLVRQGDKTYGVARMDVSFDQTIRPPVCPSTGSHGVAENAAPLAGMHANDPFQCTPSGEQKAKP